MNDFKRNDRFGGKPRFQRPGGGFSRPQVQMYPATCAQCGKATEVPFRPDGQRPIYCRDCLGGNKSFESAPPREFPKREFQKPAFRAPIAPQAQPQPQRQAPDSRIDDIQRHLAKALVKLDQILLEIAVAKAQESAEATVVKKKKPSKKK